jgi:hypothetical protein
MISIDDFWWIITLSCLIGLNIGFLITSKSKIKTIHIFVIIYLIFPLVFMIKDYYGTL